MAFAQGIPLLPYRPHHMIVLSILNKVWDHLINLNLDKQQMDFNISPVLQGTCLY